MFRSVAHYENPGISVRLAGMHKSVKSLIRQAFSIAGLKKFALSCELYHIGETFRGGCKNGIQAEDVGLFTKVL